MGVRSGGVKRVLLWLTIVAVALAVFLLYRSRSSSDLQVTPEAAQEIEKAKRR
jgi:hypothetical protein